MPSPEIGYCSFSGKADVLVLRDICMIRTVLLRSYVLYDNECEHLCNLTIANR